MEGNVAEGQPAFEAGSCDKIGTGGRLEEGRGGEAGLGPSWRPLLLTFRGAEGGGVYGLSL